jgi:hypothetical protein
MIAGNHSVTNHAGRMPTRVFARDLLTTDRYLLNVHCYLIGIMHPLYCPHTLAMMEG